MDEEDAAARRCRNVVVMQRLRAIAGSRPLHFVVLLAALMVPWPAAGRFYGHVVAAIAGVALPDTDAGASAALQFGPRPGDTGAAVSDPWHLQVFARDPGNGEFVGTALDLRRSGYLASAVFAALALTMTAPTRWRKRLGLLFGGVALLQVLPLLPLLTFFSGRLPVTVFDLSKATVWAAEIAYRSLVAPPGMAYAVPALLWLLMVWLIEPGVLKATSFTFSSSAAQAKPLTHERHQAGRRRNAARTGRTDRAGRRRSEFVPRPRL